MSGCLGNIARILHTPPTKMGNPFLTIERGYRHSSHPHVCLGRHRRAGSRSSKGLASTSRCGDPRLAHRFAGHRRGQLDIQSATPACRAGEGEANLPALAGGQPRMRRPPVNAGPHVMRGVRDFSSTGGLRFVRIEAGRTIGRGNRRQADQASASRRQAGPGGGELRPTFNWDIAACTPHKHDIPDDRRYGCRRRPTPTRAGRPSRTRGSGDLPRLRTRRPSARDDVMMRVKSRCLPRVKDHASRTARRSLPMACSPRPSPSLTSPARIWKGDR